MPSVFGCLPSRSRCGNVPNEFVHRAGPPFLDNHYVARFLMIYDIVFDSLSKLQLYSCVWPKKMICNNALQGHQIQYDKHIII